MVEASTSAGLREIGAIELMLFSPQLEHGAVIDHIRQKLATT